GNSQLDEGEISSISFSNNQAQVDLGEGNSDDTFMMIINSPFPSQQTVSISLNSLSGSLSSLTMEEGLEEEESLLVDEFSAEGFHARLRDLENEIKDEAGSDDDTLSSLTLQASQADKQLGDINYFKVLSSLSSLSQSAYVKAELRFKSDTLYVYADLNSPDALTDADIKRLASDFQDIAVPYERDDFGNESDLNGDGHITILMTPVINQMSTSGGIITGFFFPGDLVCSQNSSTASNCQEIFYTLVPDPDGEYGNRLSVSFVVDQILPGVLAHEYEHMISFNERVLERKGSPEVSWLEEGKAHFAEDLTGFSLENFSRVKICLDSINSISLTSAGSAGLAVRGCSYLLLRYLYEQSDDGDAFMNRLINTTERGTDNLEAAFAGSDPDFDDFNEFYSRWTIALALTDTGLTDDPRFTYQSMTTHPQTGLPSGICLICNAPDSRGTRLTGPKFTSLSGSNPTLTVKPTSAHFVQFTRPSSPLVLRGTTGSELSGYVVPLN
ncbi:MAG: hypothetical protein Q7S00_06680, partial [bacterium]|nr:hypothetical protein [bacterium]